MTDENSGVLVLGCGHTRCNTVIYRHRKTEVEAPMCRTLKKTIIFKWLKSPLLEDVGKDAQDGIQGCDLCHFISPVFPHEPYHLSIVCRSVTSPSPRNWVDMQDLESTLDIWSQNSHIQDSHEICIHIEVWEFLLLSNTENHENVRSETSNRRREW